MIMPDEGKLDQLKDTTDKASDFKIMLFKNTPTLVAGTVLADLTECDYAGYARQSVAYGSRSINGSGRAESTITPVTFTCSGGGTTNIVQGYAQINTVTGKVRWATYGTAPRSMGASGDTYVVALTANETQG